MTKKRVIKKSAQSPVVLIAGGAGFIGSHLVRLLLSRKARVVVVDNFNTGKELHVKEFLDNPSFALYNLDINVGFPEEIESVDYVFHLAGVEEYLYSKEFLNLDTLLTNSYGTKHLLDLAQKSNAKFLLVSSIDVYQGRMSQLNLGSYFGDSVEEQTKYSIVEAKRFAEALVWEYYKKHDIDARIVRLPEVYGPKMSLDSSGILGKFLKDLIEGRNLRIFGDGYEKEYYLYVADAVEGIVKSIFSDETKGNIYSLVDGNAISTLEVAFLLKGLADREVDIQFRPGKTSAVPKLVSPDTLNLKDIGWRPVVNFKQGVLKTLTWYGYSPNEYGFKPGKLIDEKNKRKKISGGVNTLQGLKEPAEKKQVVDSVASEKPREVPAVLDAPKMDAKVAKAPKVKKEKRQGRVKRSGEKGRFVSVFISVAGALFLAALVTFLIIPGIRFYTNLNKGVSSLREIKNSVNSFDSGKIAEYSSSSYESLNTAKESLNRLSWAFSLVGKKVNFYSYDKLIGSLVHFSKATYAISYVVDPFENLWTVVRPDTEDKLTLDDFAEANSNLNIAKSHLQLAEADFKYVNQSYLPEKYKGELKEYDTVISYGLSEMDFVSSIIADLPEVLGLKDERKYIVWFQNSNELRPTGGFIGSYGILDFKDGKLVNLIIDDIYNPDGQIDIRNITVAPPQEIADYLAEDRLYLRNANWDPDFPTSAEEFKDLYFKVTGEDVDGVIAVDLEFTKGLLNVTGPLFLTAYGEEINSSNFYERTQYHSEFNYENGSDQKKSFLTVLGGKLLENLFALEKESLPDLLTHLEVSLNSRDLLIYIPDVSLHTYMHERKWDGSLVEPDGAYLYVVDSNLGGNKSNYYVEPSAYFEVESLTRDGVLRGLLRLDYKHTGEDLSWPGGVYEDFVRVYTGYGTKLTSAKYINASGEEKDVMEEISIRSDSKYTAFGYGVSVEPNENVSLVLGFDLPDASTITSENKDFSLYWQRQPGSSKTPVQFVFTPPFGMEPVATSPNLEVSSRMAKFSGYLDSDKEFVVRLE